MIDGRKTVVPSEDASTALLRQRLRPEEARARVMAGVQRREEDEPLHAGALGGPHQAERRERVQLLDRPARLVADRRRQVHDRVDPAQRVTERARVGEVAERDLDPHPLVAQPALVAHQSAHGQAVRCEGRSSAEPTVPVAPVRRITPRRERVRWDSRRSPAPPSTAISDGVKLRLWLHA